MELVPGFVELLQGLSATMTAPSFASLTTVLTGWVFASRHTITRMILAAGDSGRETLLVVSPVVQRGPLVARRDGARGV